MCNKGEATFFTLFSSLNGFFKNAFRKKVLLPKKSSQNLFDQEEMSLIIFQLPIFRTVASSAILFITVG
jgi:hypothetical protein